LNIVHAWLNTEQRKYKTRPATYKKSFANDFTSFKILGASSSVTPPVAAVAVSAVLPVDVLAVPELAMPEFTGSKFALVKLEQSSVATREKT
jgi:hypothetical protein